MSTQNKADGATPAPALEMLNISKSFPGVRALRDVSMAVQAAEVHALVGENGAGKSTLIKIATGAQQPDEGRVIMEGQQVATVDRAGMWARGMRCIYQERQVVPDLSVAENVLLDDLPRRRGLIDWRTMRRIAAERLDRLGIELDPDRPVRGLSVAQLQLIEVARALSDDARLVVMDEPTAALHRSEVARLFEVVRALRASGVAVLYISHHLDEIFELADSVTVLRDGAVVDSVPIDGLSTATLTEMMFGRRVEQAKADRHPVEGKTVIALDRVSLPGSLQDVDLEIRAGEVLVVTGGLGSGTSELAAVVTGATAATQGDVTMAGAGVIKGRRATAERVALLPADRKRRGLLLDESVLTNITLGALGRRGSPVIDPRKTRALAARLAKLGGVKAANIDVKVRTLSGGNQQKVMVGRWLDEPRDVIVIDEPTAGIDISSKFEIYEQVRQLAADGAAVLVCTTDFQEVGQLADRVVVLRDGQIVAELSGSEATEHHLIEVEAAA